MARVNHKHYLFSLIILLIFPLSTMAAPAISCHCFTDRSYNPSHPALADPYFLATTQNSFFAAVFNVDKKTIVMKKQTGTSADDLWVAYWVASRSGQSAEALLQSRTTKESWRAVMAPSGLPAQSLGTRFSHELTAGASSSRLAQEVVDDILIRYRLLGDAELAGMRKNGASNQELIIAVLIAGKVKQPARQIHLDVQKGLKSWGTFLQEAQIAAPEIQREIAALLKVHVR